MIYSCFDPLSGMYRYYQDAKQVATNADLPVPRLSSMAGKIGVPAMDAGRPLPPDARPTGEGWHAKGMIVMCGRPSGGGLGAEGTPGEAWDWIKSGGWKWIAGAGLAVWIVRRL